MSNFDARSKVAPKFCNKKEQHEILPSEIGASAKARPEFICSLQLYMQFSARATSS